MNEPGEQKPLVSHLTPETLQAANPAGRGNLISRPLFRFAFAYWILFIVPLPPLWLAIVPWVGRHVLHVDASVRYWFQAFLGAGDTTFHYVQMFCALALAAVVALAWTSLDRGRGNYARLHVWLRVILRRTCGDADGQETKAVTMFDNKLTIDDIAGEGESVAVRYTERGTFRGPPPTGKSFEMVAMEWFIVKDGKILRRWGARDSASWARQIGLPPG